MAPINRVYLNEEQSFMADRLAEYILNLPLFLRNFNICDASHEALPWWDKNGSVKHIWCFTPKGCGHFMSTGYCDWYHTPEELVQLMSDHIEFVYNQLLENEQNPHSTLVEEPIGVALWLVEYWRSKGFSIL